MCDIVRLSNTIASCSKEQATAEHVAVCYNRACSNVLQQSMYQFTTTEHVAVCSMCVQPSQLLKEQATAEHVAFFATAVHVGSMCVK